MGYIFTITTLSSILFAQESHAINFEHLNVEDGLPSNFIINAVQDEQGFMWFATKNGLAKYDGIEFTVYRQESDNPNSLSNNYVWSILKDHNGTLWASTLGGGVNKFDPISETFTRYQHNENNPNSLVSDIVLSICEDKTGILWIATDSGFSRFDPNHETFVNYKHNKNDPNSLSENYIFSIYQDDNGMLWIGTFGGGLNKFDPSTETFTHYQHNENNPNSLANDSIFQIYGDNEETLWIATTGGLDHYDSNSDTFTHYQHDKNNPNSLSIDSLVSIFKDSKGILWIGTTGGGLNQFYRANNRFIHYQYEPSNPNSLSDNTVFGTYEDINGTLWMMTQNGGINKYEQGSDRFAHYKHHPLEKNGLNNNKIGAIHEDKSEKELKQIAGIEIAGFMEPAEEVGGDYYDVLEHEGRVLIGIGDVTGHGLESGVLAIMVQSAVRALLANEETDPVKFLSALNEVVYRNVERMNADKNLTLALLNYQNGEIRLTGQHEEIIVVRNGELELIDTIDLGFPIGLDDNIADLIAETKVSLQSGNVVVLYTDGITEAFNLNEVEYGLERLCKVVKQNWQRTAQEIREAVVSDVRQFIGTQKVFDDITLLVLKQK
jgi:ligand-binding sensor domain-containing protein